MQIQDKNGIEFLDLKLKFESTIAADFFVSPSTVSMFCTGYYPRKSLSNAPHRITLSLRRIRDTVEKINS